MSGRPINFFLPNRRRCDECGYYEKTNTFSTTHFSKKVEEIKYMNNNRMVNDYIFDKTFARTKKLECVNSKCSSRGKNNPEIILLTTDKRPEIGYLCSTCKSLWGKY